MHMKSYLKILPAVIILLAVSFPAGCQDSTRDGGAPQRAAIIDQLYLLEPNPDFIAGAKAILESSGFTVDIWQGKEVTVDFYRELPRLGYKLIVLRVHSGLLLTLEESKAEPLEKTYLFSGETYSTTRYVSEQLTDKVSNALMNESYPLVFAINSEFIRKDTGGKFDNTVVIAMGCESYFYEDLAVAFSEKGASSYIGWSTIISLEYVDRATLDLLDNLCSGNLTLGQGIEKTMKELGRDPYFQAYLRYYPPESGSRYIKELIR